MKQKFTMLLFLAITHTNTFDQSTIKAQKTIIGTSDNELLRKYLT